jgi:hypothetical protein
MLTRALATWSTLSSGMADASAWSASMLLRAGGKEKFGGWSPCVLSSWERSNICLLYEREAKRETRLGTTPSPAGGGLYKDICPTVLFLLENIANTCSSWVVILMAILSNLLYILKRFFVDFNRRGRRQSVQKSSNQVKFNQQRTLNASQANPSSKFCWPFTSQCMIYCCRFDRIELADHDIMRSHKSQQWRVKHYFHVLWDAQLQSNSLPSSCHSSWELI